MNTFKKIEAAREHAQNNNVSYVIEIEHKTDGHCYIAARVGAEQLRKAGPTEIATIIADYPARVYNAADLEALMPQHCERCGRKLNKESTHLHNSSYQGITGKAAYCDNCHKLLSTMLHE